MDNIEYLTVGEVAKMLKVKEETIRRKIRNKEIKATFEFNKYYISSEEIKRLLEPKEPEPKQH